MLLQIIISILLAIIGYLWFWPRRPDNRIPEWIENDLDDTLASVDEIGDDDDETFFSVDMSRPRLRGKIIRLAKNEFGLLSRSKANRLMVRKFIRERMVELGMRPSHISDHLDWCTVCVFVPSKREIAAHQMGATLSANVRDVEAHTSWSGYRDQLGGFLSFVGE